ncbi:uncharacterized protein LOC133740187 [Rosa rugosa]|uniref:uncharacterized protein LOC133740187 n=1 Tax=Rosa rugosa TaxID=74645 RepID=UPI002B40119B|nr:uncharacterized protein LOC133740187 [Rosa rugosa]
MADSTLPPDLPDLVMHQIILLLPTKPAIRMSSLSKQYEGIWSALRVLDFKEGELPHDDDDANDKHAKFINILARYLAFRKKDEQQPLLDKLTLHMRYLFGDEDAIIRKVLSNSLERHVKELDISLRSKHQEVECCYCLSRTVLMNAKNLTTLNLEYLRIKEIDSAETEPLCPSLKTLSLKTVHFDDKALFYLVLGCPAVEYLSLTSCSFDTPVLHVSSSSLRSLEVKNCDAEQIEVDKATNLESFTFVSKFPLLQSITLNDTINLNYIKIRAQYLTYFGLFGCHDHLNATVNTPSLHHLDIHAHLTAKVSVNAPNLWLASITLEEEEFSNYNWSWKHFATFCDFLKAFCSKNIILVMRDFKAIIFPDNFKSACYPPLPSTNRLDLIMSNPPTEESDISDLEESLLWMAPNAEEMVFAQLV